MKKLLLIPLIFVLVVALLQWVFSSWLKLIIFLAILFLLDVYLLRSSIATSKTINAYLNRSTRYLKKLLQTKNIIIEIQNYNQIQKVILLLTSLVLIIGLPYATLNKLYGDHTKAITDCKEIENGEIVVVTNTNRSHVIIGWVSSPYPTFHPTNKCNSVTYDYSDFGLTFIELLIIILLCSFLYFCFVVFQTPIKIDNEE